MIKIFTGSDRVRAKEAITDFLGDSYEVYDGVDIELAEMINIFRGTSLFETERKILLRDVGENKAVFEKVIDYLDTPHKIALLESKLDKRSSAYKELKDKVEILDFELPKNPNFRVVFDIYKTAKTDGAKAVGLLGKIKNDEDPIQFAGLLNSQAIKDFAVRQSEKEKRTLKELSRLDMNLKNSRLQPWLLIESFLMQMPSWWT